MADYVNLVKLCVGADSVADLERWQADRRARNGGGEICHVTRMWPKREAELTAGGSLYWVIRGAIVVRQPILRLERVDGGDGITRCGIVLDPQLRRTEPAARKPFQGWRYLAPGDAPRDLPASRAGDDELPPELDAHLAALGVL